MANPSQTNGPWVFSVNNDCSEVAENDTIKHSMWQLKESLVSFSEWSVVASSDSSSVKNIGDGSPDLWTAWADLVWGNPGVAHSWIILENSVTGEQLCIDCNTGVYSWFEVVYSATGSFAVDGTTSDRPTDTESVIIKDRIRRTFDAGLDGAVVHAMISADGKCTRWCISQRDATYYGGWYVGLEELVETPTVWTSAHKRCVFVWDWDISVFNTPSGKDPRALYFDSDRWRCYLEDDTPYAGWDACYSTCECYNGFNVNGGDAVYRNVNNLTWLGGYSAAPIGIYRVDAERGGSLGRLQDIYWAPYAQDTYDMSDATKQDWIVFGCFMVPWNDTVPTSP